MLRAFGNGLWLVEGPVVDGAAGFRYPTRMAILRGAEEELAIWSPVAITPELRAEVTALGPVRQIVAPNALHHLYLKDWASAFPAAEVLAAPRLVAKRFDIRFDGELPQDAPAAWAGRIETVLCPNRIAPEVVFYHAESRAVLVADLLQRLPKGWFTGWRGWVARMDRMTEAEPTVPRKFRMATNDRATARAAVARMIGWAPERLVIAHGAPVEAGATEVLRRAFGWLSP